MDFHGLQPRAVNIAQVYRQTGIVLRDSNFPTGALSTREKGRKKKSPGLRLLVSALQEYQVVLQNLGPSPIQPRTTCEADQPARVPSTEGEVPKPSRAPGGSESRFFRLSWDPGGHIAQ